MLGGPVSRPQSGVTNTGPLGKAGIPVKPDSTSSAAKATGPEGSQKQTGGMMQRISEFFKSVVSFFTGGGGSKPAELPAKTAGNASPTSRFSVVQESKIEQHYLNLSGPEQPTPNESTLSALTSAASKYAADAAAHVGSLGSMEGVFSANKTPEEKQQQITDTVTRTIDNFAKSLRPESLPSEKELDKLSKILESAQDRLATGAKCEAQTTGLDLIAVAKQDLAKLKELRGSQATATAAQSAYSECPTPANKENLLRAHAELTAVQTSLSQESTIGKASSDLASNLVEKSTSFIKRDEIMTARMADISKLDKKGLETLYKEIKEGKPEITEGLTKEDISVLKTAVGKSLMIATMVSDGASSKDVKAAAKELIKTLTTPSPGCVRAMTEQEATSMVQSKVIDSITQEVGKASTKAELTALKSTIENFFQPTGLAHELEHDFGIKPQQLNNLLLETATTFATKFADNQNISQMSIGEIRQAKEQLPALLHNVMSSLEHTGMSKEQTAALRAQSAVVATNLDHMDHFATHFDSRDKGEAGVGDGAKFSGLSTENKAQILQLYQFGGIDKSDPATSQFLGKMVSTFEKTSDPNTIVHYMMNGVQSTEPGKQSQSQYGFLRFVADHNDLSGKGNSEFDGTLLKLGKASEQIQRFSDNPSVRPGITEAQHKLISALSTFSNMLNESNPSLKLPTGATLAHLKFDAATISAFSNAAGGTDHVNVTLARIVDLQDKIQSGAPLIGPPSEGAKRVMEEAKLVPRGQSTAQFVDSLKLSGVNSSREMKLFLETLGDTSKEMAGDALKKDKTLVTMLSVSFERALLMANDRLTAGLSAANEEKTISETLSSVGSSVQETGTQAKLAIKGTVNTFLGNDAPSVTKYQGDVKLLLDKQAKLERMKEVAIADSGMIPGSDDKSGTASARAFQLQDAGVPGFPLGDGPSSSMGWAVKASGFPIDTIKVNGKDVKIEGEHLQLWQNMQFLDAERAEVKKGVTSFATTEDRSISKAFAAKLAALKGTGTLTTDYNAALKSGIVPGIVKVENGVPKFYEIQRDASGTVTEKSPGAALTQKQFQDYTKELGKCKPRSGTVDILKSQIQAPPGGKLPDHTNVDLNQYLERRELGEQIKQTTGRSGDIDAGHIQLAQNIQIHQSELKELAQPLPPTAFATTSDPKVDAAIAQKLEFLAKGNDGSKEGLTPVIVKVVDGKVGIYELERGPQGETKDTTTLIGHLTQEQTRQYTAALQTADKSKSGTTDVLLSRYKDFDFTKPEIHAYLGQTQLKGMTDALTKISEALDDKRAKFDEVANKPVLHSLTKSINDHLIAQISSGVSQSDALKDGAAIESAALAAIQASPPRNTKIPPEADLKAMIRYVVQDYQARGNEALAGVSASVELTTAARTQVLEKSASESLAGKEAAALDQISKLDSQLESISSGSKKSVSLNLSAVVAGVDVSVGAKVSQSMEVEVHRDTEKTAESPKGKLVVDLKAGFGAGVSAGTGFLSTLSATLGVSVDGSKVVRCTFESDQKAAAFMAALESGRPELAICHVESVGIGSAKSVSIEAQLSGEYIIAKSITPSFEKNFKGTIERSNVPIETETGRRVDISKSASVHYDAAGSLNIGGIDAGSSNVSFDTTYSTKERVNPTNGKIDSYSQQEVMSLFVNGETFTGSRTGKNIGEVRLAQTVDLDRLQQQFPAQRGELQQLLTGFDPNNQKLSVVETLKPDQVLAYNQTSDPATRERILLNPANYTMTISIVDTTASTSEKTKSIGVASASVETHSAQSTFTSVTVDSSFSISRKLDFEKLDSDVIQAPRSHSAPTLGSKEPIAVHAQNTRLQKSQEAPPRL